MRIGEDMMDELVVGKAGGRYSMQRESYVLIVCKKTDFINCSGYCRIRDWSTTSDDRNKSRHHHNLHSGLTQPSLSP